MNHFILSLFIVFGVLSCSGDNQTTPSANDEKLITLEEHARQTSISVIDTDFSKGRLTNHQELTLWDVQKLHGHLCDGLVVGFIGLREGLYKLYPDSIIDRTNTRIVVRSSPCIGDVGLYLSGGRYQFNSFYVDNSIDGIYVVQRIDTGEAFAIKLKEGVKSPVIDELGTKAVNLELDACTLDSLKTLEDHFSQKLFESTPSDLFEITDLENFQWQPMLKSDFIKTDVLNKNTAGCKEN